MGSLERMIQWHKEQEGYIEKESAKELDKKTANRGDKNYTKYSRDVDALGLMGCQGQPWCATYQFDAEVKQFGKEKALRNWCMTEKSYVGYNCFATFNKFKAAGKVGMTPKLGALVIFNFSHMGRVISIFTRKGKKYYLCAEGNTSSNLNDRNGGMVKIKERKFNDLSTVKGFCYIDYPEHETVPEPQKKSGWYKEDGGWRFYLGNSGKYVVNDWYLHANGRYTWHDGNGIAVHDTWYQYKNRWYYFAGDCYMVSSQWVQHKGNWYYLQADGSMAVNTYVKPKDPSGLYYWVDSDGVWQPEWDTSHPDLTKYTVTE